MKNDTPSTQHSWTGVILAGGQSSRMGSDKAELTLDGSTLLERAQSLLSHCGAENVVVIRRDHTADIYPNCGPLGGIHTAIHHHTNQPMVVIPVDLPLLGEEDITQLVKAGQNDQCISRFAGQYIPLYIPTPAALLLPLTERLEQGRPLSLRSFFEHYPSIEIAPSSPNTLLNANTPEEWQEFLASR